MPLSILCYLYIVCDCNHTIKRYLNIFFNKTSEVSMLRVITTVSILLFIFLQNPLYAAEINITSDTTWTDDSITVYKSIRIQNGATLTIDSGANVYFSEYITIDDSATLQINSNCFIGSKSINILQDASLFIEKGTTINISGTIANWGQIKATGSEIDSIIFKGYTNNGGIKFYKQSAYTDSSFFNYCIFTDLGKVAPATKALTIDSISYLSINNSTFEGCTYGPLDINEAIIDINNCLFDNNEDGKISIGNSTVNFNNCSITNSDNTYGAIAIDTSTVKFTNCTFSEINTSRPSYKNGCIYSNHSTVSLDSCTVKLSSYNGTSPYGSGIMAFNRSNATISNSTFYKCTISNSYNGGVVFGDSSNITIENTLFDSCLTDDEGAMVYSSQCTTIVKKSEFRDNTLNNNGRCGVLYTDNSFLDMSTSYIKRTVIKNSDLSGVLTFEKAISHITNCEISKTNNTSYDYAFTMYIENSDIQLINSSIINSYTGGHINYKCHGIYITDTSSCEIINSNLWNINGNTIFLDGKNDITNVKLRNSNIQFAQDSIKFSGGTISSYLNCINAYPMFADSAASNYSLLTGSPLINTGTVDTGGLKVGAIDIIGNSRIFEGRIDIGPYEYDGLVPIIEDSKPIQNNGILIKNGKLFIGKGHKKLQMVLFKANGQCSGTIKINKDAVVYDLDDELNGKIANGLYFINLVDNRKKLLHFKYIKN